MRGVLVEADPKAIAELRGVSKIYGSGDLAVKALDQLDLVIREGDYLAVMGASGSGKSTAMNILGCLDRPTQGSYCRWRVWAQRPRIRGASMRTGTNGRARAR